MALVRGVGVGGQGKKRGGSYTLLAPWSAACVSTAGLSVQLHHCRLAEDVVTRIERLLLRLFLVV